MAGVSSSSKKLPLRSTAKGQKRKASSQAPEAELGSSDPICSSSPEIGYRFRSTSAAKAFSD